MVRDPLYYYFQREWRVISDVVVDGIDADCNLTDAERTRILKTSPEFFGEIINLRHRQVLRIDACSLIREIDGRSVHELIASIYVPEQWESRAKLILNKFGLGSRLRTIAATDAELEIV